MTKPAWRSNPSTRTRYHQSRTTMSYAAWVEAREPDPATGATLAPTDGHDTVDGASSAHGARRPLSPGWAAAVADLRARRGYPPE